mmetsp:Transcript_70797/g.189006  ORF Transcript_70797/g.189006 Transcript_70797/m.189006 type:complete len:92 (+) Transcript_70797:450-725(+)
MASHNPRKKLKMVPSWPTGLMSFSGVLHIGHFLIRAGPDNRMCDARQVPWNECPHRVCIDSEQFSKSSKQMEHVPPAFSNARSVHILSSML